MYRADVQEHAYRISRANGGASVVDGQTFEQIEAYGRERWLRELAEEIRTYRYRPEAVRQVYIPKAGQPGALATFLPVPIMTRWTNTAS